MRLRGEVGGWPQRLSLLVGGDKDELAPEAGTDHRDHRDHHPAKSGSFPSVKSPFPL